MNANPQGAGLGAACGRSVQALTVRAGRRARPSSHETSTGRVNVATWPGGPFVEATASTASRPRSCGGIGGPHPR